MSSVFQSCFPFCLVVVLNLLWIISIVRLVSFRYTRLLNVTNGDTRGPSILTKVGYYLDNTGERKLKIYPCFFGNIPWFFYILNASFLSIHLEIKTRWEIVCFFLVAFLVWMDETRKQFVVAREINFWSNSSMMLFHFVSLQNPFVCMFLYLYLYICLFVHH